jgi:hypothetical protein
MEVRLAKMAQPQFDLHAAVVNAASSWNEVAPIVFVPTDQQEFERLAAILDEIAQIVQGNEAHPLANLLYVIATLVEQYEQEHDPDA